MTSGFWNLAALPHHTGLLILYVTATSFVAASVFAFVRTIQNTLYSEDLQQDNAWRYDVNRINELRRQDWVYRIFYPLMGALARFNRVAFRDNMPEIGRQIQAAGLSRFWTPEEYLAKQEIVAVLLSPAIIYICVQMMGPPGALLGVVLTLVLAYLLRRRLATQAKRRLMQIKRRMPFLLDLLTLLMEAGSTFLQSLAEASDQYREHAVGHEFSRVLAEISMGKSRATAFESMRDRLHDDEITSIIGSINQGEQLGTPLARIFRTQADVLRIKRTQRAETIAGEAGVKMLLPAVLIMASTVIVILGPFILQFIYSPFM